MQYIGQIGQIIKPSTWKRGEFLLKLPFWGDLAHFFLRRFVPQSGKYRRFYLKKLQIHLVDSCVDLTYMQSD